MRGIVGVIAIAVAGAGGCATSSAGGGADAEASADAASPPDAPPPADARQPDGAPVGPGFFIDDTAADFAGDETETDRTVIAAYGAIEPFTYYAGGLAARGSDHGIFTSAAASTTWADIQAMAFDGPTAAARDLSEAWAGGIPQGLGITDGEHFTITYEGEIFLAAGMWTFYAAADNHIFIEIAQPNTTSYARVVSADHPTEEQGTFNSSGDAWYPVRIAISEITGAASLSVQVTGPGAPTRRDLSRHDLRFRADAVPGLFLAGFDDSHMLGGHVSTIDAAAPANADWAQGNPADLGITSADSFATRWAGQLRIDVADDYTFRYISDDGQRLWIDGVLVLDDWDDTAHDNSSTPIHLDAGWHDIVVDHSESSGSARATLTMARGALPAEPLDPALLRPVVNRRERYDTGVDTTNRAIPDSGSVTASVAIDAPPGAKARGVEVRYRLDHSYHGDLEITLRAPDGSATVLRDNAGGGASGALTERFLVTALDDANASGTWELEVDDTTSLDSGTLQEFQLTVHHQAGGDSVARAATFISAVKDLGTTPTAFEMLSWGERLAPGASIQLRLRSGGSPNEVTTAPWSTPMVDANGSDVPELPRRYVQYRIDFTSDGDGAPAVDWVRLDYGEGAQ